MTEPYSPIRRQLFVASKQALSDDQRSRNEIARAIGVHAGRLSNLAHDRIQDFSSDALITILTRLGYTVTMTVSRLPSP